MSLNNNNSDLEYRGQHPPYSLSLQADETHREQHQEMNPEHVFAVKCQQVNCSLCDDCTTAAASDIQYYGDDSTTAPSASASEVCANHSSQDEYFLKIPTKYNKTQHIDTGPDTVVAPSRQQSRCTYQYLNSQPNFQIDLGHSTLSIPERKIIPPHDTSNATTNNLTSTITTSRDYDDDVRVKMSSLQTTGADSHSTAQSQSSQSSCASGNTFISSVSATQHNDGNGINAATHQHFKTRRCTPLGTPEDCKRLSDFNHFLRSECLKLVLAQTAKNKIKINQVGIQCRFCAHVAHRERGGRSSTFPSKVGNIYQTVMMMINGHFPCKHMPSNVRKRYNILKMEKCSADSLFPRKYWKESALSCGMRDGPEGGIFMIPTLLSADEIAAFVLKLIRSGDF